MTTDIAIRYCDEYLTRNISDIDKEFLKKAKEALQQEPCDKCVYSTREGCQYDDITETIPPFETSDDAVNRQAVLDLINADWKYEGLEEPINSLPPVTPQPKTGHWIEERTYMICPNCHDIWHYEANQTERFEFCPTCGKGLNNESKHIRNRVRNNRTN